MPSRQKFPSRKNATRKPRRCRVCPNQPLKSQCICSKQAKKGKSARAAAPLPLEESTDNDITHELPEGSRAQTPEEAQETPQVPETQETEQTTMTETIPIDPLLLRVGDRGNFSPVDLPASTAGDTSDTDKEEGRSQDKYKRLTTAQKINMNGTVQGVQRGNLPYVIPRHKKPRDPITWLSKSTHRYNRELPQIISRAERMADETDSYVLLLAQQAKGSSALVHYSSQRLRREAPEDLTSLIQQFQTMMTNIVLAKRADTLEMTKKWQLSEQARKEAEEQVVEAERQTKRMEDVVNSKSAELEASQAINQRLMAQLEHYKRLSAA